MNPTRLMGLAGLLATGFVVLGWDLLFLSPVSPLLRSDENALVLVMPGAATQAPFLVLREADGNTNGRPDNGRARVEALGLQPAGPAAPARRSGGIHVYVPVKLAVRRDGDTLVAALPRTLFHQGGATLLVPRGAGVQVTVPVGWQRAESPGWIRSAVRVLPARERAAPSASPESAAAAAGMDPVEVRVGLSGAARALAAAVAVPVLVALLGRAVAPVTARRRGDRVQGSHVAALALLGAAYATAFLLPVAMALVRVLPAAAFVMPRLPAVVLFAGGGTWVTLLLVHAVAGPAWRRALVPSDEPFPVPPAGRADLYLMLAPMGIGTLAVVAQQYALPLSWQVRLVTDATWFISAQVLLSAVALLGLVLVPDLLWPPQVIRETEYTRRFESLFRRAGLRGFKVAVVPGAYADVNAWVSPLYLLPGFRRIHVTRRLFEALEPDELEAVVAHEVAHLERKQLLVQGGLFMAMAVVAPAALFATRDRILNLVGDNGLLAVAALVALALPYGWVVRMVPPSVVRRLEKAADRRAVELTGNREAFVRALRKLRDDSTPEEDLEGPAALRTHPSVEERVANVAGDEAGDTADPTRSDEPS